MLNSLSTRYHAYRNCIGRSWITDASVFWACIVPMVSTLECKPMNNKWGRPVNETIKNTPRQNACSDCEACIFCKVYFHSQSHLPHTRVCSRDDVQCVTVSASLTVSSCQVTSLVFCMSPSVCLLILCELKLWTDTNLAASYMCVCSVYRLLDDGSVPFPLRMSCSYNGHPLCECTRVRVFMYEEHFILSSVWMTSSCRGWTL